MTENLESQLKDLFDAWRDVHVRKGWGERFFEDGLPGYEEAYVKANPRVLYICKESHDDGEQHVEFWFRDEVRSGPKTCQFTRRIRLLQGLITGGDDNLEGIAFMNLDKRGGGAATYFPRLRKYTRDPEIRPLLRREIEILAPEIIVTGSCAGLVREILKGSDFTGELVDAFHPKYRRSDEKFVARFLEKRA